MELLRGRRRPRSEGKTAADPATKRTIMERGGPVFSALVYRMATGACAATRDGVTRAMETGKPDWALKLLKKKPKLQRHPPFDRGLAGAIDSIGFPPLPTVGGSHASPQSGIGTRSSGCGNRTPPKSLTGWGSNCPVRTPWGSPAVSVPGSAWSSPRSWPRKSPKLGDAGILSLDDWDDAASVASSMAAMLIDDVPLPPPALELGEEMLRQRSCAKSSWSSHSPPSPNSWMTPRSRCRRTRPRHS